MTLPPLSGHPHAGVARYAASARPLVLLATAGQLLAGPLRAQAAAPLTPADSALVGRVLLAEDRRDSTDAAIAAALRHPDPRLQLLARRAVGRIRDPLFAARDSLPPLAPAPVWPEPAWRLRYRALATGTPCAALVAAFADSAWPVRLRAADLAAAQCAGDAPAAATLRSWLAALPADASRRRPGEVSWHAAAHALVALGTLDPPAARAAMPALARRREWPLRRAVARTAAVLGDTATLRALVGDRHANVREEAIGALAKLTGHADDARYLAAIEGDAPQSVRAAARALAGSPRADVPAAASAAFERWVRRANASERDVRVALLAAAGRPFTDDRPPAARTVLPPDAVALALGAERRIRVTMADEGGGGSFVVRLRGDVAPMMAARILALVRAGFYDGLTWHRVEHDFVIQGGTPGDNEFVGAADYLRDELGTLAHPRGTVGMSTRGHDTGDAQWFINLRDNARLRRDYTVFGEVIEGIDVVDGVLELDRIARMRVESRRDINQPTSE